MTEKHALAFLEGGRLREVVAVRVLTVFTRTNENKSYVWYEYEITWSRGHCSFKLFSGFFLQLAYIPCFPIWRSKANVNGLFDYISGHFISILHKYFEIKHVTLGSCFMVELL